MQRSLFSWLEYLSRAVVGQAVLLVPGVAQWTRPVIMCTPSVPTHSLALGCTVCVYLG